MRKLTLIMAFLVGMSYTISAAEQPMSITQVQVEEQVDNSNQKSDFGNNTRQFGRRFGNDKKEAQEEKEE